MRTHPGRQDVRKLLDLDLAPFLAGVGAIMIAAGLIWWRLR